MRGGDGKAVESEEEEGSSVRDAGGVEMRICGMRTKPKMMAEVLLWLCRGSLCGAWSGERGVCGGEVLWQGRCCGGWHVLTRKSAAAIS